MHAKEVINGLILGGIFDLDDILEMKPDVLVPLEILPGSVWDKGFRGEILYCPITDFSVLPDDVLDRYVERIAAMHRDGKRVAVFCIGGHGRTGYLASCVLFALGYEKPIDFIHDNYNRCAIETLPQYEAVKRYMTRH